MTIGREDPLSQAFSGWVEKGYEALGEDAKKASVTRSWRFWAKTPKGGLLVVGIVRDSCDAIGRPYPLLLMGSGPVPDWHDKWHLLPYACDATWIQMEHLCARRYDNTSRFQKEFASAIRPPDPDWSSFEQEVSRALEAPENHVAFNDIKIRAESLAKLEEFIVGVETAGFDSVLSVLTLWHTIVREMGAGPPNAVFMGGTNTRSHLALFNRALSSSDFATLWSVDLKEEQEKWN